MASTKETALLALKAALVEAGFTVERNLDIAVVAKDLGGATTWVNMLDGDPGDPEFVSSPPTWIYEHVAELQVIVIEATAGTLDADFDTLLVAVAAALTDTTLGGAVEFLELGQPQDVGPIPLGSTKPAKFGTVPITLHYTTTNPLT